MLPVVISLALLRFFERSLRRGSSSEEILASCVEAFEGALSPSDEDGGDIDVATVTINELEEELLLEAWETESLETAKFSPETELDDRVKDLVVFLCIGFGGDSGRAESVGVDATSCLAIVDGSAETSFFFFVGPCGFDDVGVLAVVDEVVATKGTDEVVVDDVCDAGGGDLISTLALEGLGVGVVGSLGIEVVGIAEGLKAAVFPVNSHLDPVSDLDAGATL
jgi:hypothetical protein